jgi:hypothetical protein
MLVIAGFVIALYGAFFIVILVDVICYFRDKNNSQRPHD